MAIIGLQRRIREIGRIRIGAQATTRTGRRAPKKLDRFRFTSPDRSVIEAVAGVYGGEAREWDNNGSPQFEVYSDATEVRIALPPNPTDMAWSQFYETWAKGFCARRCDGTFDQVRDKPCDCDPENRNCKPTTRLSFLMPDIAGLGVWRLESHGYYAATELAGAVELIEQMAGVHSVIPARLRLEQRSVRRLIDGKPEVRNFAVPVIDLDVSILGVRAIAVTMGEGGEMPELPAGWEPVPELEPPAVLSVVAQVEEATKPRTPAPRKNAAAPLPATGRKPRTAAEATEENCALCGKPYGAEPLVRNHDGPSRYVHRACKDQTPKDNGETGASDNTEAPQDVGEPSATAPEADGGSGPPSLTAEPAPTVARDSVPADPQPAMGASQLQNRKMHAMATKLWPESDTDTRRRITLDICAALGTPGLTSRSQLSRDQATTLIDALTAIESGECAWDDEAGRLINTTTGEIVGFSPT